MEFLRIIEEPMNNFFAGQRGVPLPPDCCSKKYAGKSRKIYRYRPGDLYFGPAPQSLKSNVICGNMIGSILLLDRLQKAGDHFGHSRTKASERFKTATQAQANRR